LKFLLISVAVFSCVCSAKFHRIGYDLSKIRAHTVKSPVNIDFIPHKLPCSYIINETIHVTGEGQNYEAVEINIYNVLGNSFKLSSEVKSPHQCEEILIRSDQRLKDPNTDKVFLAYYAGVTEEDFDTENIMLEEEEAISSIHENLEPFENSWSMYNVTKTKFHGRDCKMYYVWDDDEEVDIYMYASEDNFILGIDYIAYDKSAQENIVYSYTMDAPLGRFVMNKILFPDCNDTRAYTAPTHDPCSNNTSSSSSSSASSSASSAYSSSHSPSSSHPHSSSSSDSSMAVITTTALVVVLSAIATTLFFLL